MRNNEERLLGIKKPEDNSSVQQSFLSYVIPTEYVDLPSKGKLYPVGHPLRDKTSIEIKQMTAKEEDILTSESYIKKGIALEKLLEAIIIDKNIRSETLATVDRAAIFLATRILAYGPEYNSATVCPSCSKQEKHIYDLSNSPSVEYFKNEDMLTENGTFFIDLPITKWKVECRSLFGRDEINNSSNKNKNESLVSDQLSMIIVSIEGATERSVLLKALDLMPAKDSKFLREEYRKHMPNVKFSLELNCECGYTGEVEVPLTLEFFWPK